MKTGAAIEFTLDFDLAAVLLHDAVHYGKAEAGAIILRGEERIKDVRDVFGFNPGPVILDRDAENFLDVTGVRRQRCRPGSRQIDIGRNREGAAGFHRVQSIDEKVEKELFDLVCIGADSIHVSMPGTSSIIVRWQHHINYSAMFPFTDAIRANSNVGLKEFSGTENTLYERVTHDPRREQIFQGAMESISVQANAMLAQSLNLQGAKYLLDVGGGNGTNLIAFARKFPQLHAAVFDSESVCEVARQNIASKNLSDRLSAVPGDCFTAPFPPEADTMLFAHFLTMNTSSGCTTRAFAQLKVNPCPGTTG